MNYIPSKHSKLRLWDTWVYVTEDEMIHLVFSPIYPVKSGAMPGMPSALTGCTGKSCQW